MCVRKMFSPPGGSLGLEFPSPEDFKPARRERGFVGCAQGSTAEPQVLHADPRAGWRAQRGRCSRNTLFLVIPTRDSATRGLRLQKFPWYQQNTQERCDLP